MDTINNRKLLLDNYYDLRKKGILFIESLYIFDCLKESGFNDGEALDLINLVRDLYIKDETGSSIGTLADNLYNYDYKNKTPRQILSDINFWSCDDEEDEED